MTLAPLVIRNLTSIPLELKSIERYDNPSNPGWVPNFGISWIANTTKNEPTSPTLAENAGYYAREDVSAYIEPFSVCDSVMPSLERNEHESLRLTFLAGGQKYRIEIPFLTNASQTLCPLAPNPQFEISAVLQSDHRHLTLYNTAHLDRWMEYLKDETPLSALSIPGTHNSPTCYKALPSVRCQAVTPREQLENGVRFFDVRVQPYSLHSPKLVLVHSVFGISLTRTRYFRGLLDDIFAFLDQHPSETLIMSLKQEGTGRWIGDDLYHVLESHYTSTSESSRWYTNSEIPTLGQARGKIVLMRRFSLPADIAGYGIDAHDWADNTPHEERATVCVQDFYEVLETRQIDDKIGYAQAQCRRAAQRVCHLPGITTDATHPAPPQPFHLNFLSASNFWRKGCWPERIARALNPAMIRWLCCEHALEGELGDGGTGIVVCDWVGAGGDWDLVRCIVGMNSRLIVREMSLKS